MSTAHKVAHSLRTTKHKTHDAGTHLVYGYLSAGIVLLMAVFFFI